MSKLIRKVGEVNVITMADQVSSLTSERLPLELIQCMLSAGERRFLVDLRSTAVDSATLGYLCMLWKKVQQEQGVLKVVVSPATKPTIDTVPTRMPFEYFQNEEEALASFRLAKE